MSILPDWFDIHGAEQQHVDGVRWYEAPIPARWHRCRAHTIGWMNDFRVVFRCRCGAIAMPYPWDQIVVWDERNSRRKKRR